MSGKLHRRFVSSEVAREFSRDAHVSLNAEADRNAWSRSSSLSLSLQRERSRSQVSTSSQSSTSRVLSNLRSKVTDIFSDSKKLKDAKRTIEIQQSEINNLKEKHRTMEEIMTSIKQVSELFATKLDSLNEQGDVIYYISKSNVQVGNDNSFVNMDMTRLNDLLVSYHENVQKLINDNQATKQELQETAKSLRNTKAKLETTVVELQQTKDELAFKLDDLTQTRTNLEETGEKLEHETLLLQEVTEDLKDMKVNGGDQSLKLEYTIGLTQSQLMVNCIEAIKSLSIRESRYLFDDLPEKGKLGVMRILRKYCQKEPKLTSMNFAESLGIETDAIESDTDVLSQDMCSLILVQWVQVSPENDADALCNKFRKLHQHGSVRGTFGSTTCDVSVSRFSGLDTDGQTGDILNGIKSIIGSGICSYKNDIRILLDHLRALRFDQTRTDSSTDKQSLTTRTAGNLVHGSTCTR